MKEINKCALCGKFKSWNKLMQMCSEGDECWLECDDCMSKSDLDVFKRLKRKRIENE